MPKPFLGRMLIEALEEDTSEYLGQKAGINEAETLKSLGFKIADVGKGKVPLKRGKILEMAPDCFGEKFQNNNGSDVGEIPSVNDIVWFVPNETFAIDPERKYHLLNDCDVVGFERGTENV